MAVETEHKKTKSDIKHCMLNKKSFKKCNLILWAKRKNNYNYNNNKNNNSDRSKNGNKVSGCFP